MYNYSGTSDTLRTSHIVLCREVVLSLAVKNILVDLVLWESEHLGP